MNIEANIRKVLERITWACERSHRSPSDVKIVAVTKGFEASAVRTAFDHGLRDFGENRIQEAEDKMGQLADLKPQVTWHMVGHLQSNKANTAMALFDIIHSVDSVKLARILSQRVQRALLILLQVNFSGEAPKSGFPLQEVAVAFNEIKQLPNLQIVGLMTIAPLTADPETVRPVFRRLRELRDSFGLKHLSMGMTDDFEVAVEEGATMLRIGRAIFGNRRL